MLLVLALAGGGVWYWQRGNAAAPRQQDAAGQRAQPAGIPVEVAAARKTDLPIYLDGLGTVQAFNTVLVRSRVDGELVKIAFQEGQMVKQGDLIAQIDPRPYQAALDQARAKKQQSEANLVSNKNDLDRTRQLAGRGFAPQQQLDQQTSTVGSTTAQIAMDQAAIENAELQLGFTTIRAPISGRTGVRLVDQGNIVRASDQAGIVEIAQIDPISVLFTAPEQQLPGIARAMGRGPVKVIALSSDARESLAQGTLNLINNQVDPASGTVRLKAVFENADERLWPGLSVNTRLLVRTLRDVVTVPEDAIQRGPDELFVFVAKDDGTVEKRGVKVGPFSERQAVIEEGLASGERVVTLGQSRLQPGSRIQVVTPQAQRTAHGGAATAPAPAAAR
ncbi:efflux RND transporter periplasmic adaptor subunit [Enterovirga sp. CN4-39]|uniref:efflux RND transporter periplasmic adaptor subunit n=1 Tax=Enterovirga sp. CN4-39 TaxID=3400910 RepID=UPI003BFC2103